MANGGAKVIAGSLGMPNNTATNIDTNKDTNTNTNTNTNTDTEEVPR